MKRPAGSPESRAGAIEELPQPDAQPDTTWSAWVETSCRKIESAEQWRQPRTFDAHGPVGHLSGGSASGIVSEFPGFGPKVVSFASNDYLGLSCHPVVVAAAHEALDRWGAGAGASRLVTGSRPVHAELEVSLAEWKRCERAIVFPTGFAANLSVLAVFAGDGANVFSDELNHASIIDGCRAARAEVTVYRHNDLVHLEHLVKSSTGRSVIVSDTIFSMDGDAADLVGLVDISRRYGALLILDEAHAVFGPELPTAIESGTVSDLGVNILRVGTLSKMLGSLGGFVAGPARFVELLVNRARPYIFTTALPPASAAAALAAVGIVQSSEGETLRRRLTELVAKVSNSVGARVGTGAGAGAGAGVNQFGHPSPIIPVIIGEEVHAVAAAAELLAHGLWVPAIRPPTVPIGTSRLRVTLSSLHTDEQVNRLIAGLATLDGATENGEAGLIEDATGSIVAP